MIAIIPEISNRETGFKQLGLLKNGMKKNSPLSIVKTMLWFGSFCLFTSLAAIAVTGLFFHFDVKPEAAMSQLQNARQAMVGLAGMCAGVSFSLVCFARYLKQALESLPGAAGR